MNAQQGTLMASAWLWAGVVLLGIYHGLNRTGGRMLEALDKAETVRAAAATLAADFGIELARVETDLAGLCSDLLEHELIVLEDVDRG